MHHSPKLLVLANAWDAGSAVIFEKAGFAASGTTSAGIAYAHGYPDGQHINFADVYAVSQRILERISIPLSVDLERGYGHDPVQIVENVRHIIELGAVGINLEDASAGDEKSLVNLHSHCELLRALADLKQQLDIPFILNARTDVYWLGLGRPEARLAMALERALAYAQAGADCVFIPGQLDADTIRTLATQIPKPLNVIAVTPFLNKQQLESLGVARLSLGSAPARAVLGHLREVATEIQQDNVAATSHNNLSYDAANQLFLDNELT
jgi:2-methylisocitrate lyase-like PEP mutase family enzyme